MQVAKKPPLVFGDGLMWPSLDGSKSFTVRKYRAGAHDFDQDEIIVGEFKDGLNILLRISAVTLKLPFRKLLSPRSDMATRGYYFDKNYYNGLKSYYPDLTWETMGAVIWFEVLKIDGTPTVQLNAHAKKE